MDNKWKMPKDGKCWWMTTTEDGGQNILRSSSIGYNIDLHDDDDDDDDDTDDGGG